MRTNRRLHRHLPLAAGALAIFLSGCQTDADHDPVFHPSIIEAKGAPRRSETSPQLELRLVAAEDGVLPSCVRVKCGPVLQRLGPLANWSARVPLDSEPPWTLRIDAWLAPSGPNPGPVFYPIEWSFWEPPADTLDLPLVPRRRLPRSVYHEALDLLQEFILPYAGSRVRRWSRRQLRVALPAGAWPVDYRGPCEEAIAIWNQVLGEDVFSAVDTNHPAEITCEVSEQIRLAYTKLMDTDECGRPLAMLIHLSPRWAPGSERYVRRVYVHELGHALGLWGHSREPLHIMNGRAVVVDVIHEDEARVARWFWKLPADFDLVLLGRPRAPSGTLPPPRASSTRCELATGRETAESRPW